MNPQSNSTDIDLDADHIRNVVRKGFSNHERLSKHPRSIMKIDFEKQIDYAINRWHAIRIKGSNPAGLKPCKTFWF